MGRPANLQNTLTLLREKHRTCVSQVDIQRDLTSGALSYETAKRWQGKGKLGPSCSHPTDGVCASMDYSDDLVLSELCKNSE